MPRLVATDLDGTLVRSDGTVDARTRDALRGAEDAGALVVFVTGRPPRWMAAVEGLVDHTTAICANGALVYDMSTRDVLSTYPLGVETLRSVVGLLRPALPDAVFAVEYGLSFACEPGYVPHPADRRIPGLRVVPLGELLDRPVTKLLLRDRVSDPDELLVRAVEVAGDLATVTTSSRDGLLEISAYGVSKATTLARFARAHGIGPGEVIAFGDMPNDLAVLGWAGHSVAVANAHPDVLAAADEVTVSNDDHGVAVVLERVFGAHVPTPRRAPETATEAEPGTACQAPSG